MITAVLVVLGVLILGAAAAYVLVLMFAGCDTDEPDAVEAADPVDEFFSTAAQVVAGTDIDLSKVIAEMHAAYLAYRRGDDIFAGAIHEPSPEVKQ